MKKIFCDRCGKEDNSACRVTVDYEYSDDFWAAETVATTRRTFDLCKECQKEFDNAIVKYIAENS